MRVSNKIAHAMLLWERDPSLRVGAGNAHRNTWEALKRRGFIVGSTGPFALTPEGAIFLRDLLDEKAKREKGEAALRAREFRNQYKRWTNSTSFTVRWTHNGINTNPSTLTFNYPLAG